VAGKLRSFSTIPIILGTLGVLYPNSWLVQKVPYLHDHYTTPVTYTKSVAYTLRRRRIVNAYALVADSTW